MEGLQCLTGMGNTISGMEAFYNQNGSMLQTSGSVVQQKW